MIIKECWFTFMTKVSWISILILFTCLFCTHAKGRVMIDLSDRGFSYIIDEAIKTIDDSLKTTISFREMSLKVPRSDGFNPTGSLTYRVSLNVKDLKFDSLEAFSSEDQVKSTLESLRELRQRLIVNSVRRIHAEISVLVAVTQNVDDIDIIARFFPSRSKIYADKSGGTENEINAILDFLKNLILSRCEKYLLKGIAKKYFKEDLKLGDVATVSAGDLSETKTLQINFNMGKVNDLNPLELGNVYTSNGSLHISGTSLGKGRLE